MSEKIATVLITGGGRRIGAAIARVFAARNWQVVIHCNRSSQEAGQLLQELPRAAAPHLMVRADLRDMNARRSILPWIQKETGAGPDCLINNASTYHRGVIGSQDFQDIQEDYLVNFFAPFDLMQQYHDLCRQGQVINLLDQRICKTDPAAGIYALAKKSLRDATEACAMAWAPHFRVNAVAPGLILPPGGDTPENRLKMERLAARTPMGRPTPETQVAECCFFLANSPEITGQILFADGGMHLAAADFQEK